MIRFLLELTANNPIFAIEPLTGLRLAALTQRIIEKEIPLSAADFGKEPKIHNLDYDVTIPGKKGQSASTSRVRVIPIHGVLTMHGRCSYGMIDYGDQIKSADENSYIDAIVLDVASPGGEVAYTETLAQIIADTKKPVVVWGNQLVASAAYRISAAADEILLAGQSTEVGSIGTLIHYLDFTRQLQAQGVDEVMILASKSTHKRKYNFSQPSEDDRALIISGLLDPHNELFLSEVASRRPGMDEKVFTGELFMADDAIAAGLADGYATIEGAMQRAATLSKNQKQSQNTMKMKETAGILQGVSDTIAKLQQRLSGSPTVEAVEAVEETAEAVETITAEQAEISRLKAENAALLNQLADQEKEMSSIRNQVSALQNELTQIGAKLTAPALPVAAEDLPKGNARPMLPQTEAAIRHFQQIGRIK